MKEETFLELHDRLLTNDHAINDSNGLCLLEFNGEHLLDNKIFFLLSPSVDDKRELAMTGYSHIFWGNGGLRKLGFDWSYNGLRQNVILLCACLNNEL